MRLRLRHETVLKQKLMESLRSVVPITVIVFALCFTVIPVPTDILLMFVVSSVMLVVGMGLFTLGTDLSMTPVGEQVGSAITKSRKLWVVVAMSLIVGCIVTVSEPDLQVLAQQVPNIDNSVIVLSVSAGVGIFLVAAMLRILFKIKLSYLLIVLYGLVFVVTAFVPGKFIPVAFDSGGVTTGPMTVPFIMAMGVGVASIRQDEGAENDSFGLVALCSVGPILAVLVLGMIYDPENSVYAMVEIPSLETSRDLWHMFTKSLPEYFGEVAVALLPIALFFFLFQIVSLRLKKESLIRICVGFVYTYLGLVIFLCGANVGFMPIGSYIGQQLGGLTFNWILIPVGMVIGYFIVMAEPAVHVLNRQVYEMTSGAIPKKAMSISLSIGVAVSVGLSMLRIVLGIPVLYLLVPGYLLAIGLSFLSPPIFTAIAFDSGGVASGPMTSTFLLPLAMGAAGACGRDVVTFAFGVVAMVAMTPLITIQVLGIYFKFRYAKEETLPEAAGMAEGGKVELEDDIQIFELEGDDR